MAKRTLIGVAAVALVAGGLYYSVFSPATFTIVKPFLAPASPSGLGIPSSAAYPTNSFPIEFSIDGHGHSTRDISVSVQLRSFAGAPATAMTIFQPMLTGNTLKATAKNPTGGQLSNVSVATMTCSGKYDIFPGFSLPFSKTVNLVFPGIVVVCPFIPSQGTKNCNVTLATKLDFPVTIDLVGNGVTVGSSSVTFPAATTGTPGSAQTASQPVAVTAPIFLCVNSPGAVPGGTCVGGTIDASSKFGGTTTVITRRYCADITCEGPPR